MLITPEEAAWKFNIGTDQAKEMLKVKTQKGIRHVVHLLHRRYWFDHMQLHRKRLNAQFYADHLVARTKFLYGSTGAWVYTTGKFTAAYPVANRLEAGDTLRRCKDNVGIPDRLRTDQAPEIIGKNTEFQAQSRMLHIDLTYTEPERWNQNNGAEKELGDL